MSIDADEEILQDFLIEASEILETLSEQLVELENNPEDKELLNAIFRGFHTVKGGAGFLNLTAMVEVCHITENIFDVLRNGGRSADSELMDTVLQALDFVNAMFDEVKGGEEPTPAPSELLQLLEQFAKPDDGSASSETAEVAEQQTSEPEQDMDALFEANRVEQPSGSANDEITDDEFEALLDQIHGSGGSAASTIDAADKSDDNNSAASGDEITDDEFEALLDELHGNGVAAENKNVEKESVNKDTSVSKNAANTPTSQSDSDAITDDEFEALLDQLHGSGKSPAASENNQAASNNSKPGKPEEKKPASANKVEAVKNRNLPNPQRKKQSHQSLQRKMNNNRLYLHLL